MSLIEESHHTFHFTLLVFYACLLSNVSYVDFRTTGFYLFTLNYLCVLKMQHINMCLFLFSVSRSDVPIRWFDHRAGLCL